MSRSLRALAFLLQFATIGLALAFVLTRLFPDRFAPAPAPVPTATRGGVAVASYADAVARTAPSVVNIYANRVVTQPAWRIFSDPVFQRFSRLPYGPARRRLEQSLGSGVIVRGDGYVITNYHVIAGAEDIFLGLQDGRVAPATVVGADAESDLAVLKIEGANFPAIGFANGDPVRVGDVVLAIGNPVNLGHTVTMGIVSATGRSNLNLSRFEDFIQTDAAINEGNSGGALVNTAGELVGINTAAAITRVGQAQGISFAIPAGAAKRVLDEIVDHGYVVRGWMGAEYADAAVSAAPTAPAGPRGVQLVAVLPGGPADTAGLRPGDVLQRYDNADIEDEADLRSREAASAPGSVVEVSGQRGGVPFAVKVTLVQRPRPQT
ncbi:MAG TPA: trypsin-like peptidase domain-containing protein [Xanthomonadales bacterium]|nr:trypsin-like peptidase domain-containing protein [Xanthomonadales bacterium]